MKDNEEDKSIRGKKERVYGVGVYTVTAHSHPALLGSDPAEFGSHFLCSGATRRYSGAIFRVT